MAGAVTALAFSSVFVKKLEGLDVPAVVVAFYRVALAALLLAPFTLWLKRKELIAMRRSEYALLLAAGLCLAVHFGAWIASLEYIPIAASVVLVDSHPILVAVASYFVLGEALAPRSIAGAILGMIGTVVICKDGFWGICGVDFLPTVCEMNCRCRCWRASAASAFGITISIPAIRKR